MDFDYSKVGLKAGLEIHQQLDSGKLFCSCPGFLRSEEPDYLVTRKLHAVAGESGEVDKAAAYYAALDKSFVYQCYEDNVCLVDLDEEPPHQVNEEALKTALHVALLLNCKIIPLTQIMRKTVVDGSNTSGFQRTFLIAQDGYLETSGGKVGIQSVCLEEDAARIIEKRDDEIIYRLDRLGIPLVEIATAPEIKTPQQAKEAALKLGEILRSCKVKRGLGTIRQDVNMSIRGGERIEIKGFQDIKSVEIVMENEVKRQLNLLQEGKKIVSEVRNATPDGKTEFLRPMPGAARMYPETDLPLLKIHREFINESKKTLPKLKSEHEEELRKTGLNQEMIKLLLNEDKVGDFKELLQVFEHPTVIGKMLLVFPKEIASHEGFSLENVFEKLNVDTLSFVLETLKKGKIKEDQVKEVLKRIAHGSLPTEAILFEKKDLHEVEEFIAKLVKEKPGLNSNAYMGLVMKEFQGKITGGEAIEIIKKYVK